MGRVKERKKGRAERLRRWKVASTAILAEARQTFAIYDDGSSLNLNCLLKHGIQGIQEILWINFYLA